MASQTPRQTAETARDKVRPRYLPTLDPSKPHIFINPIKKINDGQDVNHFLVSKAYSDIGSFIMQLNIAMCPKKLLSNVDPQTWQIDSQLDLPEPVSKLKELLQKVEAVIEEVPPDTGPRRFGNISFRRWYEVIESRTKELLQAYLPAETLNFASASESSAVDELTSYFLGGFGSAQRLDYGTGHELSFLAFLACIWKLGGFGHEFGGGGELERTIVLGVIEPYLNVIRHLIMTYTLEPAGSHGVWGLDDHFFLSYILGSSQYCPAIDKDQAMPIEGSLPNTPNPGDVTKKHVVDSERRRNMYFSAIGFINDVKTGPFWEHSPILFDISGVRAGWGKINKGMIKMYNAEVLSKFPVVQHFPFGSLLSWDLDPNAETIGPSVHTSVQPSNTSTSASIYTSRPNQLSNLGITPTATSWTTRGPAGISVPSTHAPWAKPPSNADASYGSGLPHLTKSPWASSSGAMTLGQGSSSDVPTRAPWAK